MSFMRSPAGQTSVAIGVFTALLIGALLTLSLPTLAASAFVVGVWFVAVSATLLFYRLTGFETKTKDWPRASVAAFVVVFAVVLVTVKVLEGALDVRPSSVIGAALSGGLTGGSAAVLGFLAASLLAKRKGRTGSPRQSSLR